MPKVSYRIQCADLKCHGNQVEDFEEKYLIRIGTAMRCAYCRGHEFVLAVTKITLDDGTVKTREDIFEEMI